ncbi:MAG: glycosyltransferase family 2 protein [Muribaculaceae bacterium]|nr:glycosyltransferase family 2 protein [Muribaculaceae bacterium]
MEKDCLLTIFTPTYNRAHTIGRTYESLCKQTNKGFKWVIVDDGSTDNTEQIVKQWQTDRKIPLEYYKKNNGGMASAHNEAFRHINTLLAVCIDSDDWMPDDGVDIILSKWKQDGSNQFAGIIGLDVFENGKVVGAPFPKTLKHCRVRDLAKIHKAVGDKKYVYVVDVIKKYLPFIEVEGEKHGGVNYLYQVIDLDYEMLCDNRPYCVVEYQNDGLSANLFNQYARNPRTYSKIREVLMTTLTDKGDVFRHAIHYVSCSIFAKDISLLWKTKHKFYVWFAIPFGILFNLYVRWKRKKLNNKS